MECIIQKLPWTEVLQAFERFRGEYAVLLQSAKGGRYSLIGFDPFLVIRAKNGVIEEIRDGVSSFSHGDPLELLKIRLQEYRPRMKYHLLPDIPFVGGAMGYLSYNYGVTFESIQQRVLDDLQTPDLFFVFPRKVMVFDHEHSLRYLVCFGETRHDIEKVFDSVKEIGHDDDDLENFVQRYAPERERRPTQRSVVQIAEGLLRMARVSRKNVRSNLTFAQYVEKIHHIQSYLQAGETYQVNFSQRFEIEFFQDPYFVYQRLTDLNPSPFQAYFQFPDMQIASCSPERLLRLYRAHREWILETRPIKGTVPRGRSLEEDQCKAQELLASSKDEAELTMIVDLARNDVGKVCERVEVNEHRVLEGYSHVWHTVSNVRGVLKDGKDFIDVIRALFPGGSITGCPKKRTMEIIDELEDFRRGIYTGSAGYIGFDGSMDFNIMIRTLAFKDGKAYFHSGGGIVVDSDPAKEYQETLHKAAALKESVLGHLEVFQ